MTFPRRLARDHLLGLANKIEVLWTDSIEGAYAEHGRKPYIVTPHPTSMVKYLVGLHELGHLIAAFDQDGFVAEARAWEWAAAHVHPDLVVYTNHRLWRDISGLLATHLPWPSTPGTAG